MSLTIEVTGELEERIRSEAAEKRVSPDLIAENALRGRFGMERLPPLASWANDALMSRLDEGLSASVWEEYHRLNARIHDDVASEDEMTQFFALNEQVEGWGALRLEIVAEIARRKGTTLNEEMAALGLLRKP